MTDLQAKTLELRQTFRRRFVDERVETVCLCGSPHRLVVLRHDRYGLPIEPSFCTVCGHVYARYRLEDAGLHEFYTTIYRAYYVGDEHRRLQKMGDPRRSDHAQEVMLPAFKQVVGDVVGCHVMEWGCGAGWNLVPFHRAGASVIGFDIDRTYIEFGRKHFGLDLRLIESGESPTDVSPPPADLVILNHVLEHVPDPRRLLLELRSAISPSGLLFIGLPLLENIVDWGFRGFFHVAHLHYFSAPYIIALVESLGFEVVAHDVRQGYQLLRWRGRTAGTSPRCRRHNLVQLTKYGGLWLVFEMPWTTLKAIVGRAPWLGDYLRWLRHRLRHGGDGGGHE